MGYLGSSIWPLVFRRLVGLLYTVVSGQHSKGVRVEARKLSSRLQNSGHWLPVQTVHKSAQVQGAREKKRVLQRVCHHLKIYNKICNEKLLFLLLMTRKE